MTTKLLKSLSNEDFTLMDNSLFSIKQSSIKFAKKFLKYEYDMGLTVPIKFFYSKSDVLGKFVYYRLTRGRTAPHNIIINKSLLYYSYLYHDNKPLIEVLKHELIHYVLYMKKLDYNDGDETFENELKKHGVPSSEVVKHNNLFTIHLSDIYTDFINDSKKTVNNGVAYVHRKQGTVITFPVKIKGKIKIIQRRRTAINIYKIK